MVRQHTILNSISWLLSTQLYKQANSRFQTQTSEFTVKRNDDMKQAGTCISWEDISVQYPEIVEMVRYLDPEIKELVSTPSYCN